MAASQHGSELVYRGTLALGRPRVARAIESVTAALCLAMPALSLLLGGSLWLCAPLAAAVAVLGGVSALYARAPGEILRTPDGRVTVRQRWRVHALAPGTLRDAVGVPRYGCEDLEIAIADGRQLTLAAESFAVGARVLAALGVDASRRRSRVSLRGDDDQRLGALSFLIPLALLFVCFALNVWIFVALVLPLFALFWRGAHAGAVALVGLDGVEIHARSGVRFVPLAGVAAAHVQGTDVKLELADGTRRSLVNASGAPDERVRALAHQVNEALNARKELAPASAWRLLDRADRSVAEWTGALRRLAGGGGYRAAAVPADELAAVLEDPDATAEQRLGAALVLDGTGSPEAKARIRAAVDTSASSSMRVALSAIADAVPDEDAIADALSEDDAAARRLAR